MRQIHKRSQWLTSLLVFLGIFFSACQPSVEVSTRLPTEVTATPTAFPTAFPTAIPPTETPIPATPTATRTPSFAVSPPPFLYIYENKLLVRTGSEAPRLLADLPDAGAVLGAKSIGDVVLVLREQGLQRVRLADGSTDTLLRFDVPARFGSLVADGTRVIYQVGVDDPQAEFGMGTHIGLYQVDSDVVREVLSLHQSVCALGLTVDGSGLYLVPRGQDPAFERVLVAALESGEIETELPIEGEIFAVVAPNDRYIATVSGGTLILYDLTQHPLIPRVVVLPNAPSYTDGLIWSPDSRILYFTLLSGHLYDSYELNNPPNSYGLWRLEVEMRKLSQVVDGQPGQMPFIATDPKWLLLYHSGQETAARINLLTEAMEFFTLPAGAVLTPKSWAYRPPSILSSDGQWLFLWLYTEDTAMLVHLPSSVSQSFDLPSPAVWVGWR